MKASPVASPLVHPAILISSDDIVLHLNLQALEQMRCEKELRIIPDASHLFEEHGKLEQVAQISAYWFSQHMFAKAPIPDHE